MKSMFFLALLCCFQLIQAASVQLKRDDFKRQHVHGWVTQNYWPGKLSLMKDASGGFLHLLSEQRGKENYGRILGRCRQVDFFAGTKVRLTVTAKGQGSLVTGLLEYEYGSRRPSYLPGQAVALGNQFKVYEFTVVLRGRVEKILPYLEVRGPGFLQVQSYGVDVLVPDDLWIRAVQPLQIVRSVEDIQPIRFRTNVRGSDVSLCQKAGTKLESYTLSVPEDGVVAYGPKLEEHPLIEVSAASQGASALSYICLEDPAAYERSRTLAKAVRLAKPMRILVLGDSLSDFYRGYNYVNRLEFWLNLMNPGKVSIRNAGVRGDYLTRMERRLQGSVPGAKVSTYQQEAYRNLFAEPYDLIFIFVGQNDTRCQRKEAFARPLIDPARQERSLRSILKFIRARSQARIVLLSPSPSQVTIFEKRLAKLPPKANLVMYGKPEFVTAFDAVNRKVCGELKLDYVDILTPMRAVRDLTSLYQPDGVHLSLAGGRLIADQLLRYVAGIKP